MPESETTIEKKPVPMRFCFNCGAELGRYRDYDRRDSCGASACAKEERYAYEQERWEAHEQLDRDMGYDRW